MSTLKNPLVPGPSANPAGATGLSAARDVPASVLQRPAQGHIERDLTSLQSRALAADAAAHAAALSQAPDQRAAHKFISSHGRKHTVVALVPKANQVTDETKSGLSGASRSETRTGVVTVVPMRAVVPPLPAGHDRRAPAPYTRSKLASEANLPPMDAKALDGAQRAVAAVAANSAHTSFGFGPYPYLDANKGASSNESASASSSSSCSEPSLTQSFDAGYCPVYTPTVLPPVPLLPVAAAPRLAPGSRGYPVDLVANSFLIKTAAQGHVSMFTVTFDPPSAIASHRAEVFMRAVTTARSGEGTKSGEGLAALRMAFDGVGLAYSTVCPLPADMTWPQVVKVLPTSLIATASSSSSRDTLLPKAKGSGKSTALAAAAADPEPCGESDPEYLAENAVTVTLDPVPGAVPLALLSQYIAARQAWFAYTAADHSAPPGSAVAAHAAEAAAALGRATRAMAATTAAAANLTLSLANTAGASSSANAAVNALFPNAYNKGAGAAAAASALSASSAGVSAGIDAYPREPKHIIRMFNAFARSMVTLQPVTTFAGSIPRALLPGSSLSAPAAGVSSSGLGALVHMAPYVFPRFTSLQYLPSGAALASTGVFLSARATAQGALVSASVKTMAVAAPVSLSSYIAAISASLPLRNNNNNNNNNSHHKAWSNDGPAANPAVLNAGDADAMRVLARALRGLRVVTTHRGAREYELTGVAATAAAHMLSMGSEKPPVSVAAFYSTKYGVELAHAADWPCVAAGEHTVLPIEVCNVLPNQMYTAGYSLKDKLLHKEIACLPALQQRTLVQNIVSLTATKTASDGSNANVVVGSDGTVFAAPASLWDPALFAPVPELLTVTARVLPPPSVFTAPHTGLVRGAPSAVAKAWVGSKTAALAPHAITAAGNIAKSGGARANAADDSGSDSGSGSGSDSDAKSKNAKKRRGASTAAATTAAKTVAATSKAKGKREKKLSAGIIRAEDAVVLSQYYNSTENNANAKSDADNSVAVAARREMMVLSEAAKTPSDAVSTTKKHITAVLNNDSNITDMNSSTNKPAKSKSATSTSASASADVDADDDRDPYRFLVKPDPLDHAAKSLCCDPNCPVLAQSLHFPPNGSVSAGSYGHNAGHGMFPPAGAALSTVDPLDNSVVERLYTSSECANTVPARLIVTAADCVHSDHGYGDASADSGSKARARGSKGTAMVDSDDDDDDINMSSKDISNKIARVTNDSLLNFGPHTLAFTANAANASKDSASAFATQQVPTLAPTAAAVCTETIPVLGAWPARSRRLVAPVPVAAPLFLLAAPVQPAVIKAFFAQLMSTAADLGLSIAPLRDVLTVRNPTQLEETLHRVMMRPAARADVVFLLCSSPRNDPLYDALKRLALTRYGVVTQGIASDKMLSREPLPPAYYHNLVLKLNTKLGGVNFRFSLPKVMLEAPSLVLGLDVDHPLRHHKIRGSHAQAQGSAAGGAGALPVNEYSHACVIGSRDLEATRYAGITLQTGVECEVTPVEHLMFAVRRHITQFLLQTGRIPERILFFRDGINEHEEHKVTQQETAAIKMACRSLDPAYNPKILVVLCTKRHSVRFWPKELPGGKGGKTGAGSGGVAGFGQRPDPEVVAELHVNKQNSNDSAAGDDSNISSDIKTETTTKKTTTPGSGARSSARTASTGEASSVPYSVPLSHPSCYTTHPTMHAPVPGTVIDSPSVTALTGNEFYLLAHAAHRGTPRPVRYTVLVNEGDGLISEQDGATAGQPQQPQQGGLTMDEIQELTYYLAHNTQRIAKTGAVPGVAQHAHSMCTQMKYLSRKYTVDAISKRAMNNSSIGGGAWSGAAALAAAAAVAGKNGEPEVWSEGLHPELWEKSFYM